MKKRAKYLEKSRWYKESKQKTLKMGQDCYNTLSEEEIK